MNELIFNQAKKFSPNIFYWDINGFRIYAGSFINYADYCRITGINWSPYKADKDSDLSNKEVGTFTPLNKESDDYKKLNIDTSFPKYFESKEFLEKAINALLDLGKTSFINSTIEPCCKCGLKDKWNSMKDNNWFCYQHCSY
jgi:hypothetical protein